MTRVGFRASLMLPIMRGSECIGTIGIVRKTAGAFSDKEIALMQSFVDQAVIAIENVRLFNETKEALEQQTATAEILRVISGSVTDTQPVFDAIVRSCRRLFAGKAVALAMPQGRHDRVGGLCQRPPGRRRRARILKPWPLDRGSGAGTCILESRLVAVPDTRRGREAVPPHARSGGQARLPVVPVRAVAARGPRDRLPDDPARRHRRVRRPGGRAGRRPSPTRP